MRLLTTVLKRFVLRLLWRYRNWSWGVGAEASEPELALVPALCSRRLTTAGIGANIGAYTMRAIPHSGACIAFEPCPDRAAAMSTLFQTAVQVEQVALSDVMGEADLRIPKGVIRVPCRCLDEYATHEFGFIKIDVEGHEEAVLRGGFEVLRQDRPSLLIEIEERHTAGSLRRIHALLTPLNYWGYFLYDGKLRPLAEFDAAVLQNPEAFCRRKKLGVYVNNFLFTQPEHLRKLAPWLRH